MKVGVRLPICDVLERIARANDPRARVWRGSDVPTEQQGIKVLGVPLGHYDFVRQHLSNVHEEHQRLLTVACRCAVCLVLYGALRASSGQLLDQEQSNPKQLSLQTMTEVCGGVWARFWGLTSSSAMQGCGMLRHFPWCWAVWGSEALHAQASQFSGPVGMGGCNPEGGRAPPRSCFSVGPSLGRQPRPSQFGSG